MQSAPQNAVVPSVRSASREGMGAGLKQAGADLNGGIPIPAARGFDDVRDPEVVQPSLPLLEEQHTLVTRSVVVAHADLPNPTNSAIGFATNIISRSHNR